MFKRNLLLLVGIICVFSLNAQLINLNPDPNGEPWYVGDLSEITPEIQARLDSIPEMIISEVSLNRVLRDVVDNSEEIYFPPIFQQQGGSCAQAAGVYYTFTYEINRLRNLPSDVEENMYPTHYTYNYLNRGDNLGPSTFIDGWLIIKYYSGCPTVATWEGIAGQNFKWMTGYDKYYSAMQNRSISESYINIETPEGLDLLKHWIDHHNVGADVGGIACFGVYWSGYQTDILPPESAEAGKSVFTQLGTNPNSGHALTFVGYNDDVMYDFDGNGQFTEDEIGAFKIANSWGDHWPTQNDSGFCYLPYWLVLEGGSPWMRNAYTIEPIENHIPQMTFKVKMTHSARNKINIKAGISEDITLMEPYPINTQRYKAYDFRHGGLLPMQGISDEPIEIGLDISSIIEETTPNKFFLVIDEDDEDDQYNGEIINFSIIDYRDGEEFEITYPETNVQILNDTSTILPITIFLPHEISEDMLIEDFIYIRGDTHVLQGAELTFASYTKVYLIDGRLIVDEGASLIIGDRVIFTGNNVTIPADETNPEEILGDRIEIYGELSIDDNVLFTAPEDKSWDGLYFYDCGTVSMVNPTFDNSKLRSEDTDVTIISGSFTDSRIDHYRKNLEVNNVDLSDSFIYANGISDEPLQQSAKVTIDNCSMNNTRSGTAIYISTYSDFEIINSSINCNSIAINIQESGSGRTHLISNNHIYGNSGFGIVLYHTYADITGYNNIHDKSVGIVGFHNCEITLIGNEYAPFQIIRNNSHAEVTFTHDSFPVTFHYNKIYDNNHNYHLVRCNGHSASGTARQHNVTNNYWGTDFDPELDFYPADAFIYDPQWDPGGITPDDPELLFAQAKQYEDEENFELARQTYKIIIATYPESEFAKASAKELLALEKKLNEERSGSDFAALKLYYETEPNMSYDEDMQKLSEDLSNYCEIEMENYETAIGYSESIIINPASLQDSVFAVIDVGYTYLLMTVNGREGFVGRLPELKPESRESFEENRDRMLSDLLESDNGLNGNSFIPNIAVLHNNYPNPFNPTTTISFSIPKESKVELAVYNIKGQKVKTLTKDYFEKGYHSIVWNGDDNSGKPVSSGIYFYKLNVNCKSKAVKKCLLVK